MLSAWDLTTKVSNSNDVHSVGLMYFISYTAAKYDVRSSTNILLNQQLQKSPSSTSHTPHHTLVCGSGRRSAAVVGPVEHALALWLGSWDVGDGPPVVGAVLLLAKQAAQRVVEVAVAVVGGGDAREHVAEEARARRPRMR